MTLGDMKQKVYSLIEEYDENADELTNDPDFSAKFNTVVNQIQTELTRYKKLPGYTEMTVAEDQEIQNNSLDSLFYQLNIIRGVEYETIADRIIFHEDGTAKIYYYKYPKQITPETEDTYKFDLPTDLLEIMPYGVAADLLKSDVSNQYGTVYAARYRELLTNLDPRYGTGGVEITGGIIV